jgi:type VI secretion system protein ImpH
MGTQGRVETAAVGQPALEAALRERPTAFEFFQAVRLLERLLAHPRLGEPQPSPSAEGAAALGGGRQPVGRFGDPTHEAVRFGVNPDIAFPASEIQALELPTTGDPARMTVNFIGLTGPEGVLPYAYSELVAAQGRMNDRALRDFLDLFHHRIVSLFYRAWEKYRFAVSYERDREDLLTQHLRDLVGLGGVGLQGRLGLRDEGLLFYAGLLAPAQRSAVGLQRLIADYFSVPVEVEQFVGGWYTLAPETQCAVGEEAVSERLGGGAVVGDEIWDPQARVRLRLGPLTRQQYDQFLPGGTAYEPIRVLARFYSRDQFDFEIQLVLARDEVPECHLDAGEPQTPLGWCTWMRTRPFGRDPDDTVLTL